MSSDFDLDRDWPERLDAAMEVRGLDFHELPEGSEKLNGESLREDVIAWTCSAVKFLETLLGAEKAGELLADCACRYPAHLLVDLRSLYAETRDLPRVHRTLQERFERFLTEDLHLEPELVEEIHRRDMGMAGRLEPGRIVATKIPASGRLRAWFAEEDEAERRRLYCHCPRVRDATLEPGRLPATYCHCGAGFYKDIWETILGIPLRVRLISSVLKGDEVCTLAVEIPFRQLHAP